MRLEMSKEELLEMFKVCQVWVRVRVRCAWWRVRVRVSDALCSGHEVGMGHEVSGR